MSSLTNDVDDIMQSKEYLHFRQDVAKQKRK
jgi:hypothetical protein